MKNSNFTVLERNVMRRSSSLIAPALVIAAALMIGNQSFADEPLFRVVVENVPGADEIEAGNIQAGIKMLEDQLNQVEQANSDDIWSTLYSGDIWSTLCAAYIADGSLNQAERACTKAVEIDPTYQALNNRGVFRVSKGDLFRAREDFERVRAPHVESYLDKLKTSDVRLVAADNFDLVNRMLAKHTPAEVKASDVKSTAAIEDLND